MHDPLHRIECWSGTHFRRAALWEVGVYILVKHHNAGPAICERLSFHKNALADRQLHHDETDQNNCRSLPTSAAPDLQANTPMESSNDINMDYSFDQEVISDNLMFDQMDRLHAANIAGRQKNSEEFQFSSTLDDEADDTHGDNDVLLQPEFQEYFELTRSSATRAASTTASTSSSAIYQDIESNSQSMAVPVGDALDNKYLRIAHINGIHHLAVVFCSCHGDNLPTDLMFSGFVPTTFHRINTVFTMKVLDIFRLSNLELKASAYTYFQLLHRLTSNAEVPSPNIYNDLRKVSRAWRWIKKLKWAGYGHSSADPMTPAAGELSIFCPTCPQPGINLPLDWKDDPNR